MKTHTCTTNCFDEKLELKVSPKKRRTKLISIRLPVWQYEGLKKMALAHGLTGYQKLIKNILANAIKGGAHD